MKQLYGENYNILMKVVEHGQYYYANIGEISEGARDNGQMEGGISVPMEL